MSIPKGFRQVSSGEKIIIIDKEENEYLLVPAENGFPEFWISAYEFSINPNSKTQWYHPGNSKKGQEPWLFISLDQARKVAEKHDGRIPTELEYERFFELCKKLHLDKEKNFIWTETCEDKAHFISRRGKERQICYPARKASCLSFRIVLNWVSIREIYDCESPWYFYINLKVI